MHVAVPTYMLIKVLQEQFFFTSCEIDAWGQEVVIWGTFSKSIEKQKEYYRSVDNQFVTASVFMCMSIFLEVHYHSMKNTSTKIGLWLIKKIKKHYVMLMLGFLLL